MKLLRKLCCSKTTRTGDNINLEQSVIADDLSVTEDREVKYNQTGLLYDFYHQNKGNGILEQRFNKNQNYLGVILITTIKQHRYQFVTFLTMFVMIKRKTWKETILMFYSVLALHCHFTLWKWSMGTDKKR